MPYRVRTIVVKVAERCNLNCGYCYMYNHVDQTYRSRPAFISADTFHQVTARAYEYLSERQRDRLAMVFHGGEPLLMHASHFQPLLAEARSMLQNRVSFGLQTNATLVTDDWIELLREFDVDVSVSVDGPPPVHDKWRVFHDGRGSYDAVVRGVRALQGAGLDPAAICVVQEGADGVATYGHLRGLGFRRIHFKLPEACHDTVAKDRSRAGLTPIADFLVPVFDEWYRSDDPAVRIRLFEAIIRRLRGAASGLEDLGSEPIDFLVIETDGQIHLSDGLRVCEDGLSGTGLNVYEHSFDRLRDGAPLMYQVAFEGLPLPPVCTSCQEVSVCGGGKPSHRYSRADGFANPSVWCDDLLRLISHVRHAVQARAVPTAPVTGG